MNYLDRLSYNMEKLGMVIERESIDSDLGFNFQQSPSMEEADRKRMIELNAVVSSENYVCGRVNGYPLPINDNALILILMTTDWKKRDLGMATVGACKIKLGIKQGRKRC